MKKLGVDIVIEATGAFATFEQARAHITAGAQRAVPTAPAKHVDAADASMVLVGVNEDQLDVSVLSSNGSCTTNSASPVMPVLEETIGVKKALLNIVPASTGPGTAIAVVGAIPTLRGRFDGMAMRVPVLTGSISSIVFLAGRQTSAGGDQRAVGGRVTATALGPRRSR